MKAAMWALGVFVIGLLAVVIANLFGNITVTNQLNYTTMKNAVEAAMYDSLDVAHYRAGFCLCTQKEKTNGKWVFNSSDEYSLYDIQYDSNNKETCGHSELNCEILYGEYRVKPKVFAESLIRRFAEMVSNNKAYTVTIQDVIEYPPKVSVRIVSTDDEMLPTSGGKYSYDISNQIDAIIEVNKESITDDTLCVETPTPTPEVTEPPVTPGVTATPTATPKEGGICKWYAEMTLAYWTISGYNTGNSVTCKRGPYPNNGYEKKGDADSLKNSWNSWAEKNCLPKNAAGKVITEMKTFGGTNFHVFTYYKVYRNDKLVNGKVKAASATEAKKNVGCTSSACKAYCY